MKALYCIHTPLYRKVPLFFDFSISSMEILCACIYFVYPIEISCIYFICVSTVGGSIIKRKNFRYEYHLKFILFNTTNVYKCKPRDATEKSTRTGVSDRGVSSRRLSFWTHFRQAGALWCMQFSEKRQREWNVSERHLCVSHGADSVTRNGRNNHPAVSLNISFIVRWKSMIVTSPCVCYSCTYWSLICIIRAVGVTSEIGEFEITTKSE